jgi:hypothetical protein
MTIFSDTYIPYDFEEKHQCLNYIEDRCQGLKKALRKIEKDNEHLRVRCPLSGDYLDVIGTEEELDWLDEQLRHRNLYRT